MNRTARRAALLAITVLVVAGAWLSLKPEGIPAGVTIPGGDGGGLPRATPQSENFDAATLEVAVKVARDLGAQAFMVSRHGHLVAEAYGHGFDANTIADAGGFATTFTALTGALALQNQVIDATSLRPFNATAIVAAIDASKAGPFAAFAGENLWKPLNAAPATLAGADGKPGTGNCCLYARVGDWMRVGTMLLDDGRYEGTTILPPGMAARFVARDGVIVNGQALWLGSMTRTSEPFTADDVFYLKGNGRWRLWMLPTLNVVILYVAPEGKAGDAWQESKLPNLVTRAVKQNPHGDPHAGLGGVAPVY